MPRYYLFGLTIATFQGISLTFFVGNSSILSVTKWGALIPIVASWVLGVASIVYGTLKLCRPGISQEVRRLIMARHVSSILFFTISQLYVQISSVYVTAISTDEVPDFDNFWVYALKIVYGGQGLIVPFTRLAEPSFYPIAMQKIKAIQWPCSR